jgi:hypothetical protein
MKKAFLFFFLMAISMTGVTAQNPQPSPAQSGQSSSDLPEYGIKVEPDRRLIVVMAALEAAGIETTLTETGNDFRGKLREDFKNLNPELSGKIKSFVESHKRKHPKATSAEIIAPFVLLAYTLSPVPDLANPVNTSDLPADLLDVLDFGSLVREFYRTSGISQKLPAYFKAYQTEGDKMRASTAKMAREILSYLHTRPEIEYGEKIKIEETDKKKPQKVETRIRERRFYVVPDLLAPAGTVIFQNIRDDYYAIVPPNTNLSASDVRRGYLQFVIDPLVLKNAKEILPLRDGIKQLLDERRKTRPQISPDVFLAVSRSLVSAVDAKEIEYRKIEAATAEARRKIDLAKTVDAKKAVSAELAAFKQSLADEMALQLSDAYERGAVLSFYFADQLKGLENSGFDIASSLRDMLLSIKTADEMNRLAQFSDARLRALSARNSSRGKTLELPKRLLEINELINKKNYEEADARLKKLLEENPNESRIFYNLGRVSSITAADAFDEELRDKRLGDAKAYYSKAIDAAGAKTDPALVQLSYVALGRIYEFYEEKDAALKMYQAAINLTDVEGGAYKEAVAAKENLTKKP